MDLAGKTIYQEAIPCQNSAVLAGRASLRKNLRALYLQQRAGLRREEGAFPNRPFAAINGRSSSKRFVKMYYFVLDSLSEMRYYQPRLRV